MSFFFLTKTMRRSSTLLRLALGAALWLPGCGSGDSTGMNLTPMQNPGSEPQIGQMQTGDGTYYGATGAGNCSYDPSPGDLMVAAMNAPQYDNSSVCGECVDVTGPLGQVTVRIVDQCPECKSGDLDLSQQAFARIADPAAGRVKISWVPVACAVSGPLSYSFKDGSSQYWMAVQVRNSRLPINKIELQQGSSWTTLDQQSYNYYVDGNSPGPGPYTFRITALGGQQVVESGVPLMPSAVVAGTQQFM